MVPVNILYIHNGIYIKMYKPQMKKIVFQHLCTERKGNHIFLIGRTLQGKSVSVKITDAKPHFCVKIPENETADDIVDTLKKEGQKYIITKGIQRAIKEEETTMPNMHAEQSDDLFEWDIIKGQDILNFKEDGLSFFVQIRCKKAWTAKLLAEYLQGGKLHMVDKQYYHAYINLSLIHI